MIALEGGTRFVRRDRLLDLLWPEEPADISRPRLRQALHFLRRHLVDAIEVAGEGGVRAHMWCDVQALEDASRAGRWAEAAAFYRGAFLGGFHLPGSRVFEDWQHAQRERLRRDAVAATLKAGEDAIERGELDTARVWLGRAAELDPYNQEVAVQVARLLHDIGKPAAARSEYAEFLARLEEAEIAHAIEAPRGPDRIGQFVQLREADEHAVRAAIDRWFSLAAEGRWQEGAEMCVRDGVMHPPNEPPVRGLDAILEWYVNRPRAKSITYDIASVLGFGDLAWVVGQFNVTVAQHGDDVTMRAKFTNGLIRTVDRGWLMFICAWSPIDDGPVL